MKALLADAQLRVALGHHQAGRLPEAEAAYRAVLTLAPDQGPALLNLGVLTLEQGRAEESVALLERAASAMPEDGSARGNLGLALSELGRWEEAEAALRQGVTLAPGWAAGHYNLGTLLKELGRTDEAVAELREAARLRPAHALTRNNLGLALMETGALAEAETELVEAAKLAPGMAAIRINLGVVCEKGGRWEDALAWYERARALDPDSATALIGMADVLRAQGHLDKAATAYRHALAIRPDDGAAWTHLGLVLKETGAIEEAVAASRQALALDPRLVEAWCNLGAALTALRRLEEAREALTRALALDPDHLQSSVNLAIAYYEMGRLEDARLSIRHALGLDPDCAEARHNHAILLDAVGDLDGAFAEASRAAERSPRFAMARLSAQQKVCDWTDFDRRTADILRSVRQGAGESPFEVLGLPSSPQDQFVCARQWAKRLRRPTHPLFPPRRGVAGRKLRVGYLSADFRRHPVAFLAAELFERHDHQRFSITGYSIGPSDESDMRRRLTASFDRFVDLWSLSHDEAARLIAADGIDILVDMTGYTFYGQPQIAALRPAPVQVNYLGYPGTMGADFFDYIIADKTVAPMEHQAYYAERIVHLPVCYQPNDTQRKIARETPTRSESGLPEQGFVFCCFNIPRKITPALFDVWMRLLRKVDGSVLWLLGGSPSAERNLAREAVARGVAPERLVFARKQELEAHLARHRLADLFLDTLPYNAHTTASDALWTGLPVVTCQGEAFAGRVASSLLRAVGLPELVTHSLEEYEALALDLAAAPARLAALRSRLVERHASLPLFDIARYTRALETAYKQMWRRYEAGEAPAAFAVEG